MPVLSFDKFLKCKFYMSPLRHALGQVTHAMTWNNKDNSSFSGGKPKNLSALSPTPQ